MSLRSSGWAAITTEALPREWTPEALTGNPSRQDQGFPSHSGPLHVLKASSNILRRTFGRCGSTEGLFVPAVRDPGSRQAERKTGLPSPAE